MTDGAGWGDLHTHSFCSDGADAPEEVVRRAADCGASLLALTDHDTVEGLARARAAAAAAGLDFLDGIELSARLGRREIHVTGLGVDPVHPDLCALAARLHAGRLERSRRMVELLAAEGIPLDLPESGDAAPSARMHIAVRLHALGVTRTVQEGFDRFLKPGRPAWVPKTLCSLGEALDAVHAAGGVGLVAHPGLTPDLHAALPELLRHPFDGIEAWHVSHSPARVGELLALAAERGLLVAGGSDCHGGVKGEPPALGKVRVPLEMLRPLRERLGR